MSDYVVKTISTEASHLWKIKDLFRQYTHLASSQATYWAWEASLNLVFSLGLWKNLGIIPLFSFLQGDSTTLSASWSGNLVPYCGPSEGNCDTGLLYAHFPKCVCCIYVIPLEANLGSQGEGFLLRDVHQWQPFWFLSLQFSLTLSITGVVFAFYIFYWCLVALQCCYTLLYSRKYQLYVYIYSLP